MAGEQLERSILERKERDELHSIATAMSLEPRPRSRKAEIIDLILQATGVGSDAAPATNGNGSGHANGTAEANGAAAPAEAPLMQLIEIGPPPARGIESEHAHPGHQQQKDDQRRSVHGRPLKSHRAS